MLMSVYTSSQVRVYMSINIIMHLLTVAATGTSCKQSMKQLLEWCAGDSRSAEMRYESAWRMGQWQSSAQHSGAAPGRPVGTNEAVLGCLKVSFSPVSHPHPI